MYCPECESDPCKFFPDEARTRQGYLRYMRQQRELEASPCVLETLFELALLLYLDTTELEDDEEG
jgi:hypothetical protein